MVYNPKTGNHEWMTSEEYKAFLAAKDAEDYEKAEKEIEAIKKQGTLYGFDEGEPGVDGRDYLVYNHNTKTYEWMTIEERREIIATRPNPWNMTTSRAGIHIDLALVGEDLDRKIRSGMDREKAFAEVKEEDELTDEDLEALRIYRG